MRRGYCVYDIDWILTNGHCYRSSHSLTREKLNDARRTARALGEKIKVTDKRYVRYSL
jgi:hypothetical protein